VTDENKTSVCSSAKGELGESAMIGMSVQWQSGLETLSGNRQASQTFKFLAYE
jgi:hypothetical protein